MLNELKIQLWKIVNCELMNNEKQQNTPSQILGDCITLFIGGFHTTGNLPAWGIYARNVERLTLQDVRLALSQDDLRPVILADTVQTLELDNLKYPHLEGVAITVVSNNVSSLQLRDTSP